MNISEFNMSGMLKTILNFGQKVWKSCLIHKEINQEFTRLQKIVGFCVILIFKIPFTISRSKITFLLAPSLSSLIFFFGSAISWETYVDNRII